MRNKILALLLLLFAARLNAADTPNTNKYKQDLTDAEKLYGLSLFWKEASYNFAYFDHVPGLDWDAAYMGYLPKVLAARTTAEYYRVLTRFSALLHDGHTGIFPPREITGPAFADCAPVLLDAIGRRAIITNVERVFQGDVPLGSEVIAVDGIPTERYLAENVIPLVCTSTERVLWRLAIRGDPYLGYGLAFGAPGTTVVFTVRTPEGLERQVRMVRDGGKRAAAGQLDMVVDEAGRRPKTILEQKWVGEGLLYVALHTFNNWEIVDYFKQQTVPELAKARGVILDIRQNGGGSTDIGTAILDYFVDQPLKGSSWRTRKHVAAFKAWGTWDPKSEEFGPYGKGNAWHSGSFHEFKPTDGPKFLVPVVVLTSSSTGSAAEDFLIFIDGLDRFVTVGEPTFGSTGQPIMFELPGGGAARICTKRDTYPDGRDFVGIGVVPEVPVEGTLGGVLGNADPCLEKGIEVLNQNLARSVSSR